MLMQLIILYILVRVEENVLLKESGKGEYKTLIIEFDV